MGAWSREQATVFYDELYATLNAVPHEGCRLARDFDSWYPEGDDTFARMTYELAAFEPVGSETANWVASFLRALDAALDSERARLRAILDGQPSIRELYAAIRG